MGVDAPPESLVPLLAELGGHARGDGWTLHYADERQLARLLSTLRNLGLPLAGAPHGWPPAEVFADLCPRGLVAGNFLEITWTAPDQHHTVER